MPSTTLDIALPRFARAIGAWLGSVQTTTVIPGGGAVITSTQLRNLGFTNNDVLNEAFVRFPDSNNGANDNVVRQIDDYVGATGAVTVRGDNLAVEGGNVTVEFYRYDPNQLRDALNDAARRSFPGLHRVVTDLTLTKAHSQNRFALPSTITPGYLLQVWQEKRLASAKTWATNIVFDKDCDLEGANIATDWVATNVTISYETDITQQPENYVVWADRQSGKAVVVNGLVGTVYLSANNPLNYRGQRISVGVWAYCLTAGRLSAAVSLDGGAAQTGPTHSGRGWELLTVSVNTGNDPSVSLQVGLHATAGAQFRYWWDELIAVAGPSEFPRTEPQRVFNWRLEGTTLVVDPALSPEQNLLLVSVAPLSSVTNGADTFEIDGRQLEHLIEWAAVSFFEQDIDQLPAEDMNAAMRRLEYFKKRAEEGAGAMVPPAVYESVY